MSIRLAVSYPPCQDFWVSWQEEANCASAHTDLFYEGTGPQLRRTAALTATDRPWGVWGGKVFRHEIASRRTA